MRMWCLFLVITASGLAQSTTGSAETTGACSPANTGNNNTFNITCQGIPEKLRVQILDVLNRVAKNQVDATAILSKLDSCMQGVQQLREQQADWRLTPAQRNTLERLLAGHKAKVEVRVIAGDRNAAIFGHDILSAVSQYNAAPDTPLNHDYGINQQIEGVRILMNSDDDAEAVLLQKALASALGINVNIYRERQRVPEKTIWVIVGAKPNPFNGR